MIIIIKKIVMIIITIITIIIITSCATLRQGSETPTVLGEGVCT